MLSPRKGHRWQLSNRDHSSDTEIQGQSWSSSPQLAYKRPTCHHLLLQQNTLVYREVPRRHLGRSFKQVSCPGDKACLRSPQQIAESHAGAALSYNQTQSLLSVRCKISPVLHILQLGFWWTQTPKPKATGELAFQEGSARQPGAGAAGPAGGARGCAGGRGGGSAGGHAAGHRVTHGREALAGKTHAQELPGQPIPQPAALTLRSQQSRQQPVPAGMRQRCPQAHLQPRPQARRALGASVPAQGGPSPLRSPPHAGGMAPST